MLPCHDRCRRSHEGNGRPRDRCLDSRAIDGAILLSLRQRKRFCTDMEDSTGSLKIRSADGEYANMVDMAGN
jgi:hypothetical protein